MRWRNMRESEHLRWFRIGLESGDVRQYSTFTARQP